MLPFPAKVQMLPKKKLIVLGAALCAAMAGAYLAASLGLFFPTSPVGKVEFEVLALAEVGSSEPIAAKPAGQQASQQASPSPEQPTEQCLERRIDACRKGDAVVRVLDPVGRPIKGVRVEVQQVSHDFIFGFGLPDLHELSKEYSPEQIRRIYRCWDRLFNAATPQNAFKMCTLQPSEGQYDFRASDDAAKWCLDHAKRMKIHALVWQDPTQGRPPWLSRYSGSVLEKTLKTHIQTVVERYKELRLSGGEPLVYAIDVLNEPAHPEASFGLTSDCCDRIFAWTRQLAGENVTLVINEYDLISSSFVNQYTNSTVGRAASLSLPAFLPILDVISDPRKVVGLQAHSYPMEYSVSQLESAAALIMSRRSAEIHITEFNYPSDGSPVDSDDYLVALERARQLEEPLPPRPTWSESYQAAACERFYRRCFSIPAITAITIWDTLDEPSWVPERKPGLMRTDLSLKPSYLVLDRLINKTWKTSVSGKTDDGGEFRFRGFYGSYKVTARGKQYRFHLPRPRRGN